MRMAVRKMNELWKTMGLALMFGFLLLHSCQGQDPADLLATPTATPTAGPTTNSTTNPTAGPTTGLTAGPAAANPTSGPAVQETTNPSKPGSVDTTDMAANAADASLPTSVPGQSESTDPMNSDVKVKEKIMMANNPVSNQGSIITNPSEEKEKNLASGSSPAVFVSVLVTGLLLAAIIVGIYYFKCHRRTNGKGMKLAEESYMADEENQGNTLVSVAPLNQPEPQEKPSLNGESQEAVKAQTPPAATNSHSTTKTADTEL
ncbi:mucin-1-like isoform X2 [Sinocyclocheilus anshuiensis]|uniref:Mucin-1-like n=1 Tax=Sinocyclocheilus anshuiensis TaxID=1608454 RepID=A0A671N424_9TELE|nr:PREDICTED: mucin-1-like isoform X2 [Sinocyclocheilus anshuiensis]